jgi:type VI secretion system protein ImpK
MRLSDCFIKLIAYVAYLTKPSAERQPTFEQVNADIQRLIAESEAIFNTGGFSSEDYDLARFAVFAWIDERLLSSEWPGKIDWMRDQLQRRYFHTTEAGEHFFQKLNTIGPHQRDVREVYYICLAMGFAGQYCNEGDDYLLDQLKISNLKVLTGGSMGVPALDHQNLFPEAYPSDRNLPAATRKGGRFSVAYLMGAVTPVILLGAMFFIYQFILNSISQTLISTVP